MFNRSQKSSLSVTLFEADRAIRAILDVLEANGESNQSGLSRFRNELSDELIAGILKELREMLSIIDILAEKIGIEPEYVDIRKRIQSEISLMWEDLHDSKSTKLRRYGEVDPVVEEEFDPYIDNLIERIESIRGILEGEGSDLDRNGNEPFYNCVEG